MTQATQMSGSNAGRNNRVQDVLVSVANTSNKNNPQRPFIIFAVLRFLSTAHMACDRLHHMPLAGPNSCTGMHACHTQPASREQPVNLPVGAVHITPAIA